MGGAFRAATKSKPPVQGEDGANLLLIAVQSPIELSHFVAVGVNLAVALCPTHTLASVLLSRLPRVVSARHGLMIEGGATLRSVGIFYRNVLQPLSERAVVIDHATGHDVQGRVCAIRDRVAKGANDYRIRGGHDVDRV
jgi:hypothetical protein